MKAFVISALVAVAAARPDVSSHAIISHGHGPVVSHAVHAPHHGAVVHHAAPLFHHAAPLVHHAAPLVHHAAPLIHHAPVVHHAPVIAHAAPVIAHPAPYHPAPAYVEQGEPAPYAYEYSKAQFNAAETADPSGNVAGSYSVALPDGRTQHVKYTADHVNGYVAEVTYEGVPVYPEEKPYAPAPAYHA